MIAFCVRQIIGETCHCALWIPADARYICPLDSRGLATHTYMYAFWIPAIRFVQPKERNLNSLMICVKVLVLVCTVGLVGGVQHRAPRAEIFCEG